MRANVPAPKHHPNQKNMKIRTILRSILIIAFISTISLPGYAAKKGEKTLGVRTGYVTRNNSADIGLYFQYTFSEYFRLQPAADMIFRHNGRDAFTFDLNAQFPIAIGSEKFSLYPFAGLNYSSWNYNRNTLDDDGIQIVTNSRTNGLGANLGAGFDLNVSPTLKLSLEGEYTFVKRNSGVRILVGIGYVF